MASAEGSWRPPRSCEDYWGEWKHCRGLRHAFHHYYAHGELPDCGRWREDYEACRAWERDRAAAAQEALCKSERARVMEKQKYAPVWKLRKSPPPDCSGQSQALAFKRHFPESGSWWLKSFSPGSCTP